MERLLIDLQPNFSLLQAMRNEGYVAIKKRHYEFVRTICEEGTVYCLKTSWGFASASSPQYEDSEGVTVQVICFWSNPALAEECQKVIWKTHELVSLPAFEFLEKWTLGMARSRLMIGTNFDDHMTGFEADPLEVAAQMLDEYHDLRIRPVFKKHKNQADFERHMRKLNS